MIAKKSRPAFYDVFLSASHRDRSVADVVRRKLTEAGLDVFDHDRLQEGEDPAEAIRRAMRESAALVVIATPTYVDSPSLLVEVGAAWGLRKPIYLLWGQEGTLDVPDHLKKFQIWPMARLDELAQELATIAEPLTEEERRALKRIYGQIGMPADQLFLNSSATDRLASKFNQACQTKKAEETLLRELLRLRKQGLLPPLKVK